MTVMNGIDLENQGPFACKHITMFVRQRKLPTSQFSLIQKELIVPRASSATQIRNPPVMRLEIAIGHLKSWLVRQSSSIEFFETSDPRTWVDYNLFKSRGIMND